METGPDTTWPPPDAAWDAADAEDLFEAWRDARADAADAHAAWRGSPARERRIAYAAFVAAADREEAAERAFLHAHGRSRAGASDVSCTSRDARAV